MIKILFKYIALLILISCSSASVYEQKNYISEIFPDIYIEIESKLYTDRIGKTIEGAFTATFENGNKQAELMFEDGMIISGSIWNEDGMLIRNYSVEHDLVKVTHLDNGHTTAEFLFEDNVLHPVSTKIWQDDGSPSIQINKYVSRVWHENGQLALEVPLIDGKMHGVGYAWYENGELAEENHYKKDQFHGIQKKWDEEGRLVSEKTYKKGELVTEM